MNNKSLSVYTVYCNPEDFPGLYVARRFYLEDGQASASGDHYASERIEPVRAWIRSHSFSRGALADSCQAPHPEDPDTIMEIWL